MPDQNEIDVSFTETQLAAIDAALTSLETATAILPVLSTEDKAAVVKAPDNADAWFVGLLNRADQNLGYLPRDFDPANVRRDLALDAALAPRHLRLARLVDRLESARFMARSDTFAALLGVRRALKDAGVAGVDDDLNEGLQRFFRRSAKATTPAKPATTA